MVTKTARILDLFDRPVTRQIEEVVKVDQTNPGAVYEEISEYVVTDTIRRSFTDILDRYDETPNKPHEGIGIWISGFFGSGKSSFAKILGYVLEGRELPGTNARDLFLQRAQDDTLRALLNGIAARIPTTAVIFDVSTDRGVRSGSEKVTEIMYRAFLRNLGYADDLGLAELEIALESERRLGQFVAAYEARYNRPWDEGKKVTAFAINQASAIMHDLEPETYPQADSWAKAKREVDISPNLLAARVFTLMERRREGRCVVFVIDEVGQYVSRSVDKILDLQGVVQALGRLGRDRALQGKRTGQAWVTVTSQEKLNEIVSSLDDKRVELARLQDRFPLRVDLAPQDISEVTSKRVLTKTAAAEAELLALYNVHQHTLAARTRIQSAIPRAVLSALDFANLYPFMPYQVDLIISIVSGLRNQPGANRATGGSNRTIIKLAQQVLINDRVNLGEKPVGTLVTLDMIYDLVEGNLTYERRQDIAEIARAVEVANTSGDDVDSPFRTADGATILRVAKAITLLGFVRDTPATAENVAAVLYPALGADSLQPAVQTAIDALVQGRMIKLTESGYQMLSAEGKQWEEERQGIALRPGDYSRQQKDVLTALLDGLTYRYKDLKTVKPTLYVGEERLGKEGDAALRLALADEGPEFAAACNEARTRSRTERTGAVWVLKQGAEVDRWTEEVHRSKEMIARHERQTRTAEEGKLLGDEKERQKDATSRLTVALTEALLGGRAYHDGVEYDVRGLGNTIKDAFTRLFEKIVPDAYPKFGLAAVKVKGDEAEVLLTAANLSGLPTVFYSGSEGLRLVVEQGGKPSIDTNAPAAREVLDYIADRAAYGEKATGKGLEAHFTGLGYGWDLDVVRVIVAALFRAGQVDVYAQGNRFRDFRDAAARDPFTRTPAFRAASFLPRSGGVSLPEKVAAAKAYQTIYGEDVELDEGMLAEAIKRRLGEEQPTLVRLSTLLQTKKLPGEEQVAQTLATCKSIVQGDNEDAVKGFAASATTVREGLELARRLREATTESNLATVDKARMVLERVLQPLRDEMMLTGPDCSTQEALQGLLPDDGSWGNDGMKAAATRLASNLRAETWYNRLADIATDSVILEKAYRERYARAGQEYLAAYTEAQARIRAHPDWPTLDATIQDRVMTPLKPRWPELAELASGTAIPFTPSLLELRESLAAVSAREAEARRLLEEALTPPTETIQRVRVRDYLGTAIGRESPDEDMEAVARRLDDALQSLRDECLRLVAEGSRVMLE
jgi:hypothetical protein